MSDASPGWAELVAAPLGPLAAPELSLAELLCLAPPLEARAAFASARPIGPER